MGYCMSRVLAVPESLGFPSLSPHLVSFDMQGNEPWRNKSPLKGLPTLLEPHYYAIDHTKLMMIGEDPATYSKQSFKLEGRG